MKNMKVAIYAVSFLWGFLEATCFFLVVDIYLSFFVIKNFTRSIKLSIVAMLGAVLGGVLIYLWSDTHAATFAAFYLNLPGIHQNLISMVQNQLHHYQNWALFLGGISGQPYKLYALYATEADIGLLSFIMTSIAARLLRFLLTIAIVKIAIKLLERKLKTKMLYIVLSVFWVVFYSFYFYHMRL